MLGIGIREKSLFRFGWLLGLFAFTQSSQAISPKLKYNEIIILCPHHHHHHCVSWIVEPRGIGKTSQFQSKFLILRPLLCRMYVTWELCTFVVAANRRRPHLSCVYEKEEIPNDRQLCEYKHWIIKYQHEVLLLRYSQARNANEEDGWNGDPSSHILSKWLSSLVSFINPFQSEAFNSQYSTALLRSQCLFVVCTVLENT